MADIGCLNFDFGARNMNSTITIPNAPSADDMGKAITLRQLRDRLSAIIADNERSGRDERNEHPVVVCVSGGTTPSGRMREDAYVPVQHALGSSLRIRTDDGYYADTMEIKSVRNPPPRRK